MGIVIQVTIANATATRGLRYTAKTNELHTTAEHNPDLTQAANQRFVANQLLLELNQQLTNVMAGVSYRIQANGVMPDGKSVIYIAEEV